MKKKSAEDYLIHPSESLKDIEAYRYYRESTKGKPNRLTYRVWRKVVGECWKEVSDNILHNDGGVYIKNLGYFAIFMNPVRKKEHMMHHTAGYKKIFNKHTDHHTYHPTLYTELAIGQTLEFWTMDRGFSQLFTRELAKELRAGRKYKLRYSTVKGLFKQINNSCI